MATTAPTKPAAPATEVPHRNSIAEWAITILILLFGTSTIAQPFVIPTSSMHNTLLTGDHLIVDKLATPKQREALIARADAATAFQGLFLALGAVALLVGGIGIGNVMMTASSNFNVPLVFAGLFVLAGLGVALYVIFSLIEGRVTGWATRKNDVIVT